MKKAKNSETHKIDILALVPQVKAGIGEGAPLGHTTKAIVEDVLEEYLQPEVESYEDCDDGTFVVHLNSGEYDLGGFKKEIIGREISRRLYNIIKRSQKSLSEEVGSSGRFN